VIVTDRTKVEPARTGVTVAWILKRLFGEAYQMENVQKLLMNEAVFAELKRTDDPAKLPAMWAEDLAKFKAVREKYLIYK